MRLGEPTAPRLGPRRVGLGQERAACHELRGQRRASTPAASPAGRPRTRPRAAPRWPSRRRRAPAPAASPRAPRGRAGRPARPPRAPSRSGRSARRRRRRRRRARPTTRRPAASRDTRCRPEQDQVAEQQPALPAGKRLVDPPAGQLHGERPAQLHTAGSALAPSRCTPRHVGARPGGYVREGSPMTRQVRCECGYTARGDTDDAVIALVLAHVATDHPDLVGIGDRRRHPRLDRAAAGLTWPR